MFFFYILSGIGAAALVGRVWIMRSNIDPNFAVELETPPNTTSQIQIQMRIQTQILTPTMQYNWGP